MSSGTTELAWFKPSYSGTQGDDCVEVAIAGQASTYGTPRTSPSPPSRSTPCILRPGRDSCPKGLNALSARCGRELDR